MGNATEAVKAVADYVTRTNEENGVAYALEQLVLSEKAMSYGQPIKER